MTNAQYHTMIFRLCMLLKSIKSFIYNGLKKVVHQVNNQVEVDELINNFDTQLNAVLVILEEAT